jgi:ribosomal protein S18 acetylase RimI-like enzyme
MRDAEVLPFAEEHLDEAGRLLAERHRRHRAATPLLSPRFEDPAVARAEVAALWAREGCSGTVAIRDDEMIGYLLGFEREPATTWGENVWIESAGHAADSGETARALYGGAAGRWHDEGRTAHYVLLPAHDTDLVDGWFRLAFGHQHTHAIQPVPATTPVPPRGIVVRRAERRDIPALAELEVSLPQHQALAPTLSSGPTWDPAEVLKEWEEDFENPDFFNVVAEHEGVVVGSASGCVLEKSSMHAGPARPDNAWFLGFAAVRPEARGLGAGRAVGEAIAAAGAERGFDCLVTDWRETNLLSSRAWRGLGYRDSFVRLHRLVGH